MSETNTATPSSATPGVTVNAKGERVIRVADFVDQAALSNAPRLTLADVLCMNESKVPSGTDKNSVLLLKPVNLYTMAAIQNKYGDLANIPSLEAMKFDEIIWFVTTLVNQDREADRRLTEDVVSRLINAENLELVGLAINEVLRPLTSPQRKVVEP